LGRGIERKWEKGKRGEAGKAAKRLNRVEIEASMKRVEGC